MSETTLIVDSADPELIARPALSWGRRFAVGAAWSVVATAVSYGSSILVYLITARLLGVEHFGEFGAVNSTTGMFGILAGLGMGLTATKYVAEFRERDPERAGRIIGLTLGATAISSVIVCVLLFAAAAPLARIFLKAERLAGIIRLGGLMLVFSAMFNAQNGVLSGFEEFRVLARNNLMRGLAALPIQLIAVWRWGLPGAVIGMASASALGCWLNHRAITRIGVAYGIHARYRNLSPELRLLWSFAIPTTGAGLMAVVMQWLTNALLVRQPGGFVQLGFLNAAYNWRALVTFLPFTIASAALPALSSMASERVDGKVAEIELANALNQLALWPVAIGTMLLGGWIVRSYGHEFLAGHVVFVTLVGGTAVGYVGNTIGTYLISEGRTWFAFVQNAAFGLMLLGITLAAVASHGAMAVSVGTGVAYFFLMVGTVCYLRARGELSAGLASRLILGGTLMGLLTALIAWLPASLGLWLAAPGMILASGVSLGLISPQLRALAWQRASSWRARRAVLRLS